MSPIAVPHLLLLTNYESVKTFISALLTLYDMNLFYLITVASIEVIQNTFDMLVGHDIEV